MTAIRAEEDVLVVGAGPAGIASAYALEQANIRYKVIDRAEVIGHTWDSLYPSLKLNTTRFYSHLPEKRFPLSYGYYPSARQYHDYLMDYVAEQDFNIHLGIEVYRIAPEGNLWRVESSEGIHLYPTVITATGIWDHPIMPDIPGMDAFSGELYHAHDFRDPQQVAGKRVLVVGNGPSGVDIAVASADVAERVHIAIRSGALMKRRYPLGFPKHAWLLIGERLPKQWCEKLMRFVNRFTNYRDPERYGLYPPGPDSGGMTAYQGPELLNAVKAGHVHPVPEPINFEGQCVEFVDGQHIEFDTVIMATGYQPVLHEYLDIEMQYSDEAWKAPSLCDWEIGPNGQRGWPLRDTSEHPNGRQILGHPGLYLVGVFYKGKGAMFNMNVEAAIAADQIKSYLRNF